MKGGNGLAKVLAKLMDAAGALTDPVDLVFRGSSMTTQSRAFDKAPRQEGRNDWFWTE